MKETIRDVDDPLIRALCDPAVYDHDVESVRVIETHISWVLLTGSYVYKVKKPVRLPFVDFSTLRRRRSFCEAELRLNRRLAPDLYLDVVPIGGSIEHPIIGAQPAIEYAVKLREFPAGARLDERLEAGEVPVGDIRELAETIAHFHGSLSSSHCSGDPVAITRAALSNVRETEQVLHGSKYRENLAALRDWITRGCVKLERAFADRELRGAIREGHGDLHLENLAYWDNRIVPFDALEFDLNLRSVDVIDEAAFLVMDLMVHDRTGLAHEFLNRYLEVSGDYAGLEVFKFYLVHRAIVRAKVSAIKESQRAGSADGVAAQVDRYLRYAFGLIQPAAPLLLITHGLSGSGKTSVTNELISRLPAIRCRSDLERKRLHGLAPYARSGSKVGAGLYTQESTQATYATLRRHAALGLRAGINVMVDAAFLGRAERESFIRLAAKERAQFTILDCNAPEPMLRQRIEAKREQSIDVSEATVEVLAHQLATNEPFDPEELGFVVPVNTQSDIDYDALERRIRTSQPPLRGQALPRNGPPSSPSRAHDESRPVADSPPNP
jgi:aminoglycoside phosphotransferase family enzyme/predicted kinase